MISRMNGVDKVTVSVRQNNTTVFLVGDIEDPTTKLQIYDNAYVLRKRRLIQTISIIE
jgi:hypothetical protein